MTDRLRSAARDDAGFTLIELLVALAIGSIVLTAVMFVFVNGLQGAGKVTDRIDATQRGRATADRIQMLLQAQVCAPNGGAPISVAGPTSVTFTANTGDVNAVPVRYRLRWDSATNGIYQDTYAPNTSVSPVSYPSSPTSTKQIGAQMQPADGATLFTYYGFNTATGGLADAPLSPVDVNQVVAVDFSLMALPERTKTADPRSMSVSGQAVAGSADPADPNEGPKC